MRTRTQEKDDDCKYREEWWWLQEHKILGRLSSHPACCLFSASPTSHLLSQKCTTPPRDAIINLSCHHFIQDVSLSLIFIFISNLLPAVTEVHNPSKRYNHCSQNVHFFAGFQTPKNTKSLINPNLSNKSLDIKCLFSQRSWKRLFDPSWLLIKMCLLGKAGDFLMNYEKFRLFSLSFPFPRCNTKRQMALWAAYWFH